MAGPTKAELEARVAELEAELAKAPAAPKAPKLDWAAVEAFVDAELAKGDDGKGFIPHVLAIKAGLERLHQQENVLNFMTIPGFGQDKERASA